MLYRIVLQPWEPQCFLLDFPYDIICGDSWGDKLVVATSSGMFVLEGNQQGFVSNIHATMCKLFLHV